MLERVVAAPLNPWQRLEMIRTFCLPRLYHGLVLGAPDPLGLRRMDIVVRRYIRRWLHLSRDCPNDLLHAPIRVSGIGIPSLAYWAPFWRRRRLAEARRLVLAGEDLEEEPGPTRDEWREALGHELYSFVDGSDLRRAADVPASTDFLRRPEEIPSLEFVQFCRLWAGALPTRTRLARGRTAVATTRCRYGCAASETIFHVLQACPRSHGGRVRRHDAVWCLCWRVLCCDWGVQSSGSRFCRWTTG